MCLGAAAAAIHESECDYGGVALKVIFVCREEFCTLLFALRSPIIFFDTV